MDDRLRYAPCIGSPQIEQGSVVLGYWGEAPVVGGKLREHFFKGGVSKKAPSCKNSS